MRLCGTGGRGVVRSRGSQFAPLRVGAEAESVEGLQGPLLRRRVRTVLDRRGVSIADPVGVVTNAGPVQMGMGRGTVDRGNGFSLAAGGGGVDSAPENCGRGVQEKAQLTEPSISCYEVWRQRRQNVLEH